MSYVEQALKKLAQEARGFKGDKYQAAMKGAVREAVEEFCRQNEEFAQAVAQGGSFADCMKAVSKGVTTHLPDIEAYRRAAAFYFNGVQVRMTPTIQLEPEETGSAQTGAIAIDLTSFFAEG